MSIHHLEDAAELELHATTKLVFMALCDDASKLTRVAHPGMDKLMQWGGVNKRRTLQIIEGLICAGLVARKAFAYPGRNAEFLVFPTAAEYADLDVADPRLNAGHPVDNSVPGPSDMGAADCTPPENGCSKSSNGCNPDCTPPVVPPDQDHETGPVIQARHQGPVDNSGTGPNPSPATLSATAHRPLDPAVVFASVGRMLPDTFDADQLRILAGEILARAIIRPGKSIRVVNPTDYVIRAIRNTTRDDERRRNQWLLRADEIASEHIELARTGRARF